MPAASAHTARLAEHSARRSILATLKELERVQAEQQGAASEPHRIRRPGAGRKKLLDQNPMIRDALERLVEPMTVGDPEAPLRWTSKSFMQLSRELQARGHTIRHVPVSVDTDHDTSSVAVSMIQRWRHAMEKSAHP